MQREIEGRILRSLEDSRTSAKELWQGVQAGIYPLQIGITGEVGTGKTTLVQALGREMGIEEALTSPTYEIMRIYHLPERSGNIRGLIHIDAYHLGESPLQRELLEEYLQSQSYLICIEWVELMPLASQIPLLHITLRATQEGQERSLSWKISEEGLALQNGQEFSPGVE